MSKRKFTRNPLICNNQETELCVGRERQKSIHKAIPHGLKSIMVGVERMGFEFSSCSAPVLLFHTMRGLCTLGETIRVLSVQWCHWSGKYQHSPYCKNFTYAILPSRTRPPLKTLWVPCPYGHPSIHKQGELSLPLCHFWFLLPRAVLHLALFCSHPFILPHSCWAFFTLSNLPFSLHKSSYSSTSPDTVNKSIWCHGLPSWDTFPTKIFIFLFQTLFNLSFNFFLLLEVDCFLT